MDFSINHDILRVDKRAFKTLRNFIALLLVCFIFLGCCLSTQKLGLFYAQVNIMKEIWKDVKGYEGCYQVSNLGRVKSLERKVRGGNNWPTRKECILKPGISRDGYLLVGFSKKNKKTTRTIHRLVIAAFLPNFNKRFDTDHIDCNKTNNCISNLRMSTECQNRMNSPKRKNCSSKYKGVCWHSYWKKWVARIRIKGKLKSLGYFHDEVEAAKAYDKAALE